MNCSDILYYTQSRCLIRKRVIYLNFNVYAASGLNLYNKKNKKYKITHFDTKNEGCRIHSETEFKKFYITI